MAFAYPNPYSSIMHTKIRLFILFLIVILTGFFWTSFQNDSSKEHTPQITSNQIESKADIEIKNFNVKHEVLGQKDWEIKANHAEIDNDNHKIKLTDVQVTLTMNENQKSVISASTGTINNATRDVELNGNVHFVTDAGSLFSQLASKDNSRVQ